MKHFIAVCEKKIEENNGFDHIFIILKSEFEAFVLNGQRMHFSRFNFLKLIIRLENNEKSMNIFD